MAGPADPFDKALKKQGLQLDGRDHAAALRVYRGLQEACQMLKKAEPKQAGRDDDQPR